MQTFSSVAFDDEQGDILFRGSTNRRLSRSLLLSLSLSLSVCLSVSHAVSASLSVSVCVSLSLSLSLFLSVCAAVNKQGLVWKLLCAIYQFSFIHLAISVGSTR